MILAAASCSSSVEPAWRCRVDADCASRGVGWICKETACAPPTATGAGGAASSSGAGGQPDCTVNQDCVDKYGSFYVCRDSACRALLSPQCSRVYGNYAAPNSIVFGILGPLTIPPGSGEPEWSVEFGQAQENTLALVQSEFDAVAPAGLPRDSGNQPTPTAFVSCDESADVDAAAKHLVEVVEVPAIIGVPGAAYLGEVAYKYAVPNNVLVLSPNATTPLVAYYPTGGLVWSLAGNRKFEGAATARYLPQIERAIRADPAYGLQPGEPIRVQVVLAATIDGGALYHSVVDTLWFNGKAAAENGSNFSWTGYIDPTLVAPHYQSPVADVLSFRPHVILPIALSTEFVQNVYPAIEAQWPTAEQPRPYYIAGSSAQNSSALSSIVKASPDPAATRARWRGAVTEETPSPVFNAYRNLYSSHFGGLPVAGAERVFDAGYLLLYATVAANHTGVLDGHAIVNGMVKLLPPGALYQIGPSDLPNVLAALSAGSDIQLEATYGVLNLDPAIGGPVKPVDIVCLNPDFAMVPSGVTYNPVTDTLSGTYSCN